MEDLQDMATELRQGDLKHDDKVIVEWIKVGLNDFYVGFYFIA